MATSVLWLSTEYLGAQYFNHRKADAGGFCFRASSKEINIKPILNLQTHMADTVPITSAYWTRKNHFFFPVVLTSFLKSRGLWFNEPWLKYCIISREARLITGTSSDVS